MSVGAWAAFSLVFCVLAAQMVALRSFKLALRVFPVGIRSQSVGIRSQSNGIRSQSVKSIRNTATSLGDTGSGDAVASVDAMPARFDSKFLQTLLERGYIHQCTDYKGLDEKFQTSVVPAYLGFDATASSLHVGSLLQIMILRTLQKSGHKPIILIGGGTTKVGDPSGKDESRQLLSEDIINRNSESISQIFRKFIKFGDGPSDAIMVNNAEWLDELNYLSFLRDYGRYFTINRMLSFESVKQRLAREQPLTFLEFNYMLLQVFFLFLAILSHILTHSLTHTHNPLILITI